MFLLWTVSDRPRRRAFIIAAVAVIGQETCGIFTLIQFAERTFILARDEQGERGEHGQHDALVSPAGYALVLGVVQLIASAVALYLVERVGRRVKNFLLQFGKKCISILLRDYSYKVL